MIRELVRLGCLGLERSDRVAVFLGAGLGGAVGAYLFFMSTADPVSWLAQHTRPH